MEKKSNVWGWKSLFAALILAAVFLLFSGKAIREETREIVLVLKVIDSSNDFWTAIIQGANMAAREYDAHLTVMGPDAETEYEEQGKMIEDAIARKPDAIALAPSSYTETLRYAKKIEEAGIRLILIDSVMEEKAGSSVVATDNVEAGRKMGSYVAEHVSDITGIGIVGHVKGVSTATQREQGFREGLGDLEEKVQEVVFCDSDYRKAYQVTKEMLKKHPQINVIAGLNEYSSVGAAKAVKDLGLAGKIRMIGFDSSMKEVKFLEDGTFEAIVVQKPLNMGYLSVETTMHLLDKKEVPENVDSGSALITKDTMYTEENQKLLFPI